MTAADVPTASTDGLTCPLCDYDLRGLAEERCPECGFRFTWAELADEQRNAHRYLFEHARRRRLRALWRTFWRTCRPRRFWRDVTPANPVAVRRLLVYWVLANAWLLAVAGGLFATAWVDVARQVSAERANWKPVAGRPGLFAYAYDRNYTHTAAEVDADSPPPGSLPFVRRVFADRYLGGHLAPLDALAVVLCWPWLSLASLLLFQASMRRAKVNPRHVLRAVVYGCDFGLLVAVPVAAVVWADHTVIEVYGWLEDAPIHGAAPLAAVVLACGGVATYRVSVAYARYLRFDRPTLTVLASQVVVVLAVGVVLVATGQLF